MRAIRLDKKDRVIGAVVLRKSGTTILVATEKGFGKRSEPDEYRVSHRGGKGIFTVKTTDKTGRMVAIREVLESDDIVVVSSGGIVIRQHASEVRLAGRNTQGVRLIKLGERDTVSDVASVMAEDQDIPDTNGKKGGDSPEGEKKTLIRNRSNATKGKAKENGASNIPASTAREAESAKTSVPRKTAPGKRPAVKTIPRHAGKPKREQRSPAKARTLMRGRNQKKKRK